MTKDDRYGAAGDSYGSSGDTYGEANGSTGSLRSQRPSEQSTETETETSTADPSNAGGVAELPFIFARRTVKADRDALPVYVRQTTADDIEALERELDSRFDGDDVMSLDVREAVVKAGLRNLDDVVDVMEEWGYGRR